MSDHPAVLHYANAFAAGAGLDLDDALGEARLAYARALHAVETGQYDPHLASFDTYATHAVYKGMLTALGRQRRRAPEVAELDEMTADTATPPPDRRLLLAELIGELPADARAVVELMLGDGADELVDAVLAGAKGAPEKLRAYIRRVLNLRRGDRAAAAFQAISEMLAEMATI